MRKPTFGNARQQSVGDVSETFLPAPIKGLADNLSMFNANPLFAKSLQNFWPVAEGLQQAPGYAQWASRVGAGEVRTLAAYQQELWAFTNNGIYDATAGGAMPAAAVVLTGSIFPPSVVNFTNSAGTVFLIETNGQDGVKNYNGAAWAASVITGPSVPSDLFHVWAFKRRLFFISDTAGEEMYAWFLPVDSIQGAASKFPVGPNFPRGGRLISGGSWTLDGGNGPDDYCFFVTDMGEIAVYEGIDPTTADSFSIVGVFYIGAVGTPNCWVREGSDVLVASRSGIFSLSAIVRGVKNSPSSAATSNIQSTWMQANKQRAYSLFYFTAKTMLIANQPVASVQYAQNRDTGAWTSFSYPAACFCEAAFGLSSGNAALNFFFGEAFSADGVIHRWGASDYNGGTMVMFCQNYPTQLSRLGNIAPTLVKTNWGKIYTSANAIAASYSDVKTMQVDFYSGTAPFQSSYWNTWQAVSCPVGRSFSFLYNVTSKRFSGVDSIESVYLGAQLQFRTGQSSMP